MEIEQVKTLLELPVETCGYIDSNFRPIIDGVAKTDKKGRNICVNNKYYNIIWHTHPRNMQAYPSAEDIIKILKTRPDDKPKISLIFTQWGIWKIWADRKGDVSNQTKYAIQKSYSGLYHITERGRGNISLPFVQSYIYELEYILSDYEFHINLTLWSDLLSGKYNI